MLAVAYLIGCAGQDPAPEQPKPDVPEETFPSETDPADWTFSDPDPDRALPEPAELEAALQIALEGILAYDARPVVDPYLARYEQSAGPLCPAAVPDNYGAEFWNIGCSAADGTYFGGYLYQSIFTDVESDGLLLSGATLSGNIILIEPDGATLDLEGTATIATGGAPDGSVVVLQSSLLGGFAYDSARATGWLQGGMQSLDVTLINYLVPPIDGRLVVVDGAINPVVAGETWSVQFGLVAANTPVGSACDSEPGGLAVIRDPAGRWIELVFDGPTLNLYTGEFLPGNPACDGCAEASLDGEPLGSVCADFTPWMTWEIAP